jgi:sulfate adenylyltransferase
MNKTDFESVINDMKLSNGTVWPVPIVLQVDESTAKFIAGEKKILLTYQNEPYVIMHLDEIYTMNKEKVAEKVFGTSEKGHPGVKNFLELGDYFLGGKITLLKRRPSSNKIYELTPKQTRKIFSERGWSKVLGFHTRNVIHKSHEFIQMEGMKKSLCDGLFIHPIIGKKKIGDFEANIIISSYEKMIETIYPKSKVIIGTFSNYSRYAGPREALFTALVRKNFGCSHFIIGRDHTGVGNFYEPKASHEIFDKFSKEEIGIIPVKFGNIFYSDLENRHLHEDDFIDYPDEHKKYVSGSGIREMLLKGIQPSEWLMRLEISQMILDKMKNGEKIFVE